MLIFAIVLSLWGDLQPGPHAVGVRQTDHFDHSRTFRTARTLDGKPRTGEHARPIRVTVWYPAGSTTGAPMTFGEYARGEEAAIVALTRNVVPLPEEQRAKGNMGAIGFSAGGRWALASAMKYPDVHAVVSLDSVMILALNTEAWPSSSNTWDSLSDAYLAAGDRAKAIELAKRANALLAAEKGLTPERRAAIQGSIDTKLKPQQ